MRTFAFHFRFSGSNAPFQLTADTIATDLHVVASDTNAVQTSMELGQKAKLKMTMTIDPYKGTLV